ncbi:hsp90 co-chaperone Cdc37 [Conoideocrella luteorostrata]|uniref:Hsp90 chaperone protein kinase-targeting subunit n=1 Tax=Conoideocrella luteorostrata TaxID=1105319 RepID=A0AAJ0CGJ0_9HYPO|nr:hsp90 co-chaperone Cdc37 [Conoideocrella luteorostrata]
MPVDYSKWDALELSDDSDVEVHPNVDKRSFIRAKQSQIHQERQQRKIQIEAYKFENTIHDALLKRISSMTTSLQSHGSEAKGASDDKAADVALKALVKTNPGPLADAVPPRPEGLDSSHPTPTTYTQMLAALIDEITKTLEERKVEEFYPAFIEELDAHAKKLTQIRKETQSKLDQLLKEEGKKITSDSIHTGFNSSHVSKAEAKGTTTKVELLNPNSNSSDSQPSNSTAAMDNDEEIEASPAAKTFAQISTKDYASSLQFISQNPQILSERETDGLLVLGFDAALERKDDYSRQCVHQALLLQYCRALGRDGVGLFFKRITTQGHQAQDVFHNDVQDTYMRIKSRAREILAQRAKEPEEGQDVEQIQLHAVEPGTVIQIKVPAANSQDAEVKKAREIFDGFKPDMKTALDSGDLDEVNKVLGRMAVDEAEEVVGLFGEANILSLAEEIIDTTTEEGKQQLKDLEDQAKADAEGQAEVAQEPVGDPE